MELTAFMYAQGGDEFYVLNRPGFWTLEASLSSGVWNYVQTNGRPDSARRCAHEHKNGVTFVGLDTGHICQLDITNAAEPAGTMTRSVITPWVGDEVTFHTIDAITVTSSLGASAGAFTLDWSEDSFATSKGAAFNYVRYAGDAPRHRAAAWVVTTASGAIAVPRHNCALRV